MHLARGCQEFEALKGYGFHSVPRVRTLRLALTKLRTTSGYLGLVQRRVSVSYLENLCFKLTARPELSTLEFSAETL
jgi:hypothetical protein